MREIKFRAWHKGDKKIIYQSDYDSFHWFWITPHGAVYRDGQYQDLILMQYTGLKGKNDVEIYEGDICLWYDMMGNKGVISYENPLPFYFVVCWDEIYARWGEHIIYRPNDKVFNDGSFLRGEVEVIGNIYENPELLKG